MPGSRLGAGEAGRRRVSGRLAQNLPAVFPPVLHVQVAIVLQPALVGLHRLGPDQPQAADRVGKDPDHPRAPPQLAVEAFQHVGRLHVLVVRQRQPVEGEVSSMCSSTQSVSAR